MSIVGILASNFFSAGPTQSSKNAGQDNPNGPSRFQQIQTEFQQLGQDLQSGNLQEAQQDFTNLQQDVQQSAGQQVGSHHHHHHVGGSQNSPQQANPIAQAFSTLAQDLQAGNLSGAQSAFAALQTDIQQIGGFLPTGPGGSSGAIASLGAGNLNVSA
jgi:outer membrane protein assembly factor BamD (BamD/ComL family)